MTRKHTFLAAFLATLMLAGCAGSLSALSAPEPQMPAPGAWLEAQGSAPTPHGAAELCARLADVCGAAGGVSVAVSSETTGASNLPDAPSDGSAIFQMLLAQRSAELAQRVEARPQEVRTLDQLTWRQLAEINARVNWDIRPASDEETYGQEEHWAMPLSMPEAHGARRGDCEDYALEKRARLIAAGWPASTLSLAMVEAPGIGVHAVLVAHTDRGDIVLDNLHEDPLALRDAPYTWLSEQSGVSLMNWVSVRADGQLRIAQSVSLPMEEGVPAREPPVQAQPALSPEAMFGALLQQSIERADLASTPNEPVSAAPSQGALPLQTPAAFESLTLAEPALENLALTSLVADFENGFSAAEPITAEATMASPTDLVSVSPSQPVDEPQMDASADPLWLNKLTLKAQCVAQAAFGRKGQAPSMKHKSAAIAGV